MTTTDRVLEILMQEGGYRQLPRPFKVGSISFDFTHALVASERANDLVIVIELKSDAVDDGAARKVMALTRALDVIGSKRPVTAILTSGQPRNETVQLINKVCRVLPVGAPTGPDAINAVRDWISILLPLAQPAAVETLLDWEADLRTVTPASNQGEFMDALITAAPHGKEIVESILAGAIIKSVTAVINDEGDDE